MNPGNNWNCSDFKRKLRSRRRRSPWINVRGVAVANSEAVKGRGKHLERGQATHCFLYMLPPFSVRGKHAGSWVTSIKHRLLWLMFSVRRWQTNVNWAFGLICKDYPVGQCASKTKVLLLLATVTVLNQLSSQYCWTRIIINEYESDATWKCCRCSPDWSRRKVCNLSYSALFHALL